MGGSEAKDSGPDCSEPPINPAAVVVDITATLGEAATAVVHALRRRWEEPDFRPGSGSPLTRVYTDAPDGAVRLPESGDLVRGVAGAAAQITKDSWYGGGPPTTESAVYSTVPIVGRAAGRADGEALSEAAREVATAYYHLLREIVDRPVLAQRAFDGRGFKHYEPEELVARMAEVRAVGLEAMLDALGFPVAHMLVEAFNEEGFSWATRDTFAGWDRVSARLTALLKEVETRTAYEYEAVAYLNGPLVDVLGGVSLGPAAPGRADVVLAYATDDALSRAAEAGFWPAYGDLPPGLRTVNATLTLRFSVPVDAPVVTFLNTYPAAAELVSRVLDVLRVVHRGDIGVTSGSNWVA